MTPKKTLAKALARYLGATAVLAYADGAKQRGQFMVVTTPSVVPVGQAEVRYRNNAAGVDLDETVSAMREVMYSVEVYRNAEAEDAGTTAEKLWLKLHGVSAREHMLGYGLAFKSIGAIRDLTTPVDAAQEPRFQFDAYYTAIQTLEEVVLSIEGIDIHAAYRSAFSEHDTTIKVRKP